MAPAVSVTGYVSDEELDRLMTWGQIASFFRRSSKVSAYRWLRRWPGAFR